MKYLSLLLALTVIAITSYSQRLEAPIDPNGLLYNITTIDHLRSIADSMQQRFHHSHPIRDYYSIQQGKGHYIRMSTGDIQAAMADIKRGIGYDEFLKKYRSAKTDSFVLVTKEYIEDGYHHQTLVRYADELYTGSVEESYFDIDLRDDRKDKWVCNSTGPASYTKEELRAFYFLRPPASERLPDKYARLIFYTDFMIDTTTPLYYKDARIDDEIGFRSRSARGPAFTRFQQYLDKQTDLFLGKQHLEKLAGSSFRDSTEQLRINFMYFAVDSLKRCYIEDSLSRSPEFQNLLSQAVTEVLDRKDLSNDDLEHYTAKYYSPDAALVMIRNRRIGYTCNIGASLLGPIRDINIARLAAATANWSVFLKTHLLFMGFEYGGKRITGIKELEDMDLHVPDLLLGSELRIANPSENHPFKYPCSVGRNLTEVADKKALEQKILSMIRSEELDDLNRLLLHNLFLNYLSFLPENKTRQAGLQQLEEADKKLPPYLYAKVKTDRLTLPSPTLHNLNFEIN